MQKLERLTKKKFLLLFSKRNKPKGSNKMNNIYILDGVRVMTNGSMIVVGEDDNANCVFQLSPGKIRVRHYSFRKEANKYG